MPGMGGALSVSGRCVPARGPLGLAERPPKPIRLHSPQPACCLRHLRTTFVTYLLGSTPTAEEARRARTLAVLGSRLPRRAVFAEGLADARGQEKMTSLATAGGMGQGTAGVAGAGGGGRGLVLSGPHPRRSLPLPAALSRGRGTRR